MVFHVVTIFPEFFASPLGVSLLGAALEKGAVDVRVHDLRDYSEGRHRSVDDAPYGGGPGMVMKPEPLIKAVESVFAASPGLHRVLLSSRGRPFTQAMAESMARKPGLMLLCGRYEGVDERVGAFVDEEVSIGDYVLAGGEAAALVLIEAVSRFVPGVLGSGDSLRQESFSPGNDFLLEYPQYTRPGEFRGMRVPEVLLSGDHGDIARWRRSMAERTTADRRPDLFARYRQRPQ